MVSSSKKYLFWPQYVAGKSVSELASIFGAKKTVTAPPLPKKTNTDEKKPSTFPFKNATTTG